MLQRLREPTRDGTPHDAVTTGIYENLPGKFRDNQQHDAAEALITLLEAACSNERVGINALRINLVSEVLGRSCPMHHASTTEIQHHHLGLVLPGHQPSQRLTIEELVDNYFANETVSYLCEICGGEKVEADKACRITSLGDCLIITIERFKRSSLSSVTTKDMRAVLIAENLNVPYGVSGEIKSYQLRAVVAHVGKTARHGHYVTHVKRRHGWFEYDDSIVRPSSIGDVVRLGHQGLTEEHTPYILMYEVTNRGSLREGGSVPRSPLFNIHDYDEDDECDGGNYNDGSPLDQQCCSKCAETKELSRCDECRCIVCPICYFKSGSKYMCEVCTERYHELAYIKKVQERDQHCDDSGEDSGSNDDNSDMGGYGDGSMGGSGSGSRNGRQECTTQQRVFGDSDDGEGNEDGDDNGDVDDDIDGYSAKIGDGKKEEECGQYDDDSGDDGGSDDDNGDKDGFG
jgi:hypothetical protein